MSLTLWKDVPNATLNASIDHASVEYNRIAISESINFDAVMIELPIERTQVSVFGNPRMTIIDNFSREGCMTPNTTVLEGGQATMIQARVDVASICENDDSTENLTIFCMKPVGSMIPCN